MKNEVQNRQCNHLYNNTKPDIPQYHNFVLNELDARFSNVSIYYKPFINGDIPDILIIGEGKGVILIDICTIKLSEYKIKDKDTFISINNNDIVLSPVRKLRNYKNNLFKTHIDGLLEQKAKHGNAAYWVIQNVVIFEYETDETIENFFGSNTVDNTKLFSKGSIQNIPILTQNKLFINKAHKSFMDKLTPRFHKRENGTVLPPYRKKQKDLLVSKAGQYKIKGVAGSGKTYVLAKRAVNSHIRHSGNVLVLTFNKSLKPYIAERIQEIQEDFDWKFFYINNYHAFINAIADNLYMPRTIVDSMINTVEKFDAKLLERYRHLLPKYKSIFIDEVQDYETKWLRIIKEYFLDEDGEFVVFGDEKQNVYDRKLDSEKKINTTIRGAWNELKESFRFNGKFVDLANGFQEKFLSNKYEIAKIEKRNEANLFDEEHIEYIKFDKNSTIKDLASAIDFMIVNDSLKPKDISIVGSKIGFLEELDMVLRKELGQKTQTMFVKKEYQSKLKNKQHIEAEKNEIDQFKKSNFDINADAIKLSTIHSFKGYEAKTLIYILTAEDNNDEVVYTAFTRAKENLYIINQGNQRYDAFFSENVYIPKSKTVQDKVVEEVEKSIEGDSRNVFGKPLETYKNTESIQLKNESLDEIMQLKKQLTEERKKTQKERMEKNNFKKQHEKSQFEVEEVNKNLEEAKKKTKIKNMVLQSTKKKNDELEKQIDKDSHLTEKGEVIECAIKIEEKLKICGVDSSYDLLNKINFISDKISDKSVSSLHNIRMYRNKNAHYHGGGDRLPEGYNMSNFRRDFKLAYDALDRLRV